MSFPPPPQQQRLLRTQSGQSPTANTAARQRERVQTITLLTSRPLNVPVGSVRGPKSTLQPKESPQANKKSKTEYEEKYEGSLAQLVLLQQKLEQQTLVSMQLERNVLEYYYANTISFEDYDGERVPQQNSVSHHYYFNSVISKAKRDRQERRAREEQLLREEQRRVESYVDDVQTRIINGALAAERTTMAEAKKELDLLQQHLAQKLAGGKACETSLLEEQNRGQQLRLKRIESEKRIQQLEEVRQQQMENIDTTRLQLEKHREELAVAQAELRKRDDVVVKLRETIGRLTRRRRQRE